MVQGEIDFSCKYIVNYSFQYTVMVEQKKKMADLVPYIHQCWVFGGFNITVYLRS